MVLVFANYTNPGPVLINDLGVRLLGFILLWTNTTKLVIIIFVWQWQLCINIVFLEYVSHGYKALNDEDIGRAAVYFDILHSRTGRTSHKGGLNLLPLLNGAQMSLDLTERKRICVESAVSTRV